jgi:DNA-binding response OmpR family regulator
MSAKILWADDEIELLKPHILFLEQKGYTVETVNNGLDAVEKCSTNQYDIIFLDENMPGISGLEALNQIKEIKPTLRVVMITKSEEESIMEEAIGSKIADYLIKPVNPNQILLSLKKNLEQNKLVSQKATADYQQEFRQIGMRLSERLNATEWAQLYAKLVYWELQLNQSEDESMAQIIKMQKKEANQQFAKFIEKNYLEWVNQTSDAPQMLHTLFKNKIASQLKKDNKTLLLVIDNLRYDQWKVIEPLIAENYTVQTDEIIYSILPTATHYARNSFFAGLLPSEIAKKFPTLWLNEEEEGGKNLHEADFLGEQLKRLGKDIKWVYHKITNNEAGKKLADNFSQYAQNNLLTIVYNFIDMLSHARTEVEMIRELADDEAAYRSITISWFEHSPLKDIILQAQQNGFTLVITTDHGTVRVKNPIKIVGEKNTNSNLRYKVGRNLSYKEKEVFCIRNPQDAFLPKSGISSEFVFAKEDDFFVYPNNYNHFVNYYGNTFQHGGISLEEILIPYIELHPK